MPVAQFWADVKTGNADLINSAIFSPTGGSIGIGFAIPSSMAKTVVEQLKKLADLHAQGVLSDDEFTAAKSKLLGQ